jgi:hypothetical protein
MCLKSLAVCEKPLINLKKPNFSDIFKIPSILYKKNLAFSKNKPHDNCRIATMASPPLDFTPSGTKIHFNEVPLKLYGFH